MGQKEDWWYEQSGVIPYRLISEESSKTSGEFSLQILLISSRKRKRWVIPKGIVEQGMSPQESAVKEAFEEAGIEGCIAETPIGVYTYQKWGGTCTVTVFLFEVTTVFETWSEDYLRDREWMSPEEAADRVREEALKDLLRKLPDFSF